jgi:hypothetical protein
MSGRIEAMTAASAAQSKRKNAPKEDEDDDSSDAGSDVVCPHSASPSFRLYGQSQSGRDSERRVEADGQSMINVDFDFYNLNPDVDQYVPVASV